MKTFQNFTNLYSLSKTLRFELIPIGETENNIKNKNILSHDKRRAEDYKRAKHIIDEYHKAYIDRRLAEFGFILEDNGQNNSLQEYYIYTKNSQASSQDTIERIQANLRKQVADHLCETEEFKRIDKQKLFRDDLPHFVSANDLELINEFKSFTTYFVGFHQNRQNMYSAEAKSTAIAYRMIHENLPKFIDNIGVFDRIKNIAEIKENILQLHKDFEADLCVNDFAEIFELQYFNSVLTQKQITLYNAVIGGRNEGEYKVKGLNEYINLYNQQHKDEKLPKFKVLYKQILSDREHLSWLPEKFESDNDLLLAVKEYYESTFEHLNNLRILLESMGSYDLNGIFLRNDSQLTNISKRIGGDWAKIQKAIVGDLMQVRKQKKREDTETYEDELNKLYKKQGSFSIGYIKEVSGLKVESTFVNLDAQDSHEQQHENIFARIDNAYTEIRSLLENPYPAHKKLIQNKEDVMLIKSFLDTLLNLLHFVKPLLGTGEEADKDNRFYGEFMPIWEQLNMLTPLYNMVRNYVTRKPYSIEKVKLNFESSQLLGGWDKNKERDCLSVILRKNGKYFLGIIDKHNTKIFDKYPADGECYEKMTYKLLPGANKMLPKVFFSKSRIDEFEPNDDVLRIYDSGTFKKGATFNLQDCHTFINFYKASIAKHEDWSKFEFNFSPTETYEDISAFYREVENQGYKITFESISTHYIDTLVKEGKLYLFQI